MCVIKGFICYYVLNLIDFNVVIKLFFINFYGSIFLMVNGIGNVVCWI